MTRPSGTRHQARGTPSLGTGHQARGTLICAGEAFEDLIFVGLDRLPALGEEVRTDRFTSTIGGGAVITAVKAARLGMKTMVISALSEQAATRLKGERITIINLRKPSEPHAITAALSTSEDRAFVTYNGVNAKLEGRLARIIPRLGVKSVAATPSLRLPAHLHLCFYPHDCGHWTRIVTRLRARGITTSWDFGWNEPLSNNRGLTDLIDALDFVFVNEHEARLYTGEATLEASIRHWRARSAITIIKIGEAGSVWVAPDREILVDAPRVMAIDTTGAGDSFNAGFLVAWLRGGSPEQCLTLGNKIGSASTTTAGGI